MRALHLTHSLNHVAAKMRDCKLDKVPLEIPDQLRLHSDCRLKFPSQLSNSSDRSSREIRPSLTGSLYQKISMSVLCERK